MKTALLAEYRKFTSTRMWWILLIGLIAYLGFVGLAMAFSLTAGTDELDATTLAGAPLARSIYALISPIGYVFPLVIGSLAVTAEFRHKTITASLLVEPRRGVLLGAKLLAGIPMGLIYGVTATATVVIAAAPLLAWRGDGAFLTDGATVEVIVFSVIVMALWLMMGVAIGSVLSNQVAAIIVLLAFTQFVEPIARVALAEFDSTSSVAKFLPGAAADGIIGSSFYSSAGSGTAIELLSRPAGAAMMVAYIVALALIGRFTTFKRDIS
ncbi:ABC transporter permease subunit [Gordonia sp. (in: high G+C Gram-positive bacteria)]|jgi:hypothetical protein|uniref:ABC transporter permease subunit n=1 Tax=Gordonia sp. (in: high G+C Gram-positive bacteria) TaxID=84139 RepID=UPI001DF6BE41|nr:ABC transporter permease subunit [Gordonia sp. (in: high G+C Gram-positive bacteria)]MCB1294967.1 ABC transporter permease subunit [Gordonia sp. (in: high G+C Gram-positive bacteria)]HMS75417.1 ABC transporter permease subunit [Gordonia sp. (in: high G+C Gram-positive bacteria)]HQV17738.1 ABC transporter permease subunit [Gordonia sp. (in: high G+C Gram-positive bacteria)]